MKTKLLLKKLSTYFPKKIAETRDYIGIQVNKIKEETNTIFLCLDFDEITYDYIIKNHLEDKIDLIITHHPFIFGKKSKVLKFDEKKRLLYEKMEQLNIPIYSYHTNFDTDKNGMNDALAESLNLQNIKQLQLEPMARGGELKEEMDVIEFSHYALEKLKVDYGTLINEGKKRIKTVAIIGGGGWHSYELAQKENYDIFISGDIPHHGRRGVVTSKYNFLNVPHEVERIFMPQMEKVLKSINSDFEILSLNHEDLPLLICNKSNCISLK